MNSVTKKNIIVNINGEITPFEDATISVFDRGFMFGDSIYEVTYTENRKILYFDEHMKRLNNSANLLDIKLTYSKEEILVQTLKTLKASGETRAYIRIIVTRGISEISLDPTNAIENNLIIIVKPQPPHPEKNYTHGIKLCISDILRNDIQSTNPNAKSGNYLNNVMAIGAAKKLGFDDAIMKNKDSHITEGTSFNIWFVKNDKVITPSLESGILKGITRDKVLEICQEHNFSHEKREVTESEIMNADEVFITSATKGIMSVSTLGDRVYGSHISDWPITEKLSELYIQKLLAHKNSSPYSY